MKRSIGAKKIRTAVFISGTGSNLKSLIKFSLLSNSPIKIDLIISDRLRAKGLYFSKKYKIKKKIYNFEKKFDAEEKILFILKKEKIKLICLAGFMKILSKKFIKKFNGKILNIHPSLLPKYKGLNTHKRVIANSEKFTGCTVHYVNKSLDSGKIIIQKKIRIKKNDSEKSIAKKVLKIEHKIYPQVINRVLANL